MCLGLGLYHPPSSPAVLLKCKQFISDKSEITHILSGDINNVMNKMLDTKMERMIKGNNSSLEALVAENVRNPEKLSYSHSNKSHMVLPQIDMSSATSIILLYILNIL